MAAGDVVARYRASSNLTVTALASIATSSTFVAGWTSAAVSNTTNLDLDVTVAAKITVAAAGLAAGQIRVYAYVRLDDANWPALFSAGAAATEGTATVTDTEVLDSGFYLLWAAVTDTSVSRVYEMPQTSVLTRIGFMPAEFAIYITHSTGANLAASGQQVTVKGVAAAVAQS